MKTGTIKDKSLGILLSLALCLSLAAPIAMPGAVKANVSNISVNPYDSNFISTSTEYQITMTAGTVLDSGKTITIKFPSDTSMPADGDDASHYLVEGTVCTVNAGVSGKELTVTVPNIVINADTSFIVTITSAAGMANPTDSSQSGADLYKAEVKTSAEPTYAPSAAYTIVGVDVYTGGTVYSDSYTTITAAIAAATDGDTITVPDKTFSEGGPIAVAKQLTFIGKRADGTTDSWDVGTAGANASCPTIELAGDPAAPILNITGTDVVLRGFEIDSTGNEWTGMNIGGTDGLLVQYCTFAADECDRAISIYDNPATDFTIDYCSFSGTGATHWFTIDEGGGCSADTLSTNLLSNNSIDGLVSRLYMYSEDIHDVTYYHNQFTNAADGIQLRRWWYGYTGGTYDDIVVDQNTFDGGANETFAFGSMTVYEQIQDSWFEGGSYDGTQVVLSHNSFGKFTGTRTTMETVCWDIQGGSPADLYAPGNYWSNASGPTHTEANIGAVTYGADVSTNVDFRPWLVAAYSTTPTGEIEITTTSPLPDGQTGVAYSETLAATGGTTPKTWGYYGPGDCAHCGYPDGLTVQSNGVINGTPTTYEADPGFMFGIQTNDGVQGTYADFSLSVYATVPTITTASLPNGTVDAAYSQTLQASGGTGSYTWSKYSGDLGDLTLNADGSITGTPTTLTTYNFTARVVSGYQAAYKALSITIGTAGDEVGFYNPDKKRYYLRDNDTASTYATFKYGSNPNSRPIAGDWDGL